MFVLFALMTKSCVFVPIVCGLLFKYLYSEYLAVHFAHVSFKCKLHARFFF